MTNIAVPYCNSTQHRPGLTHSTQIAHVWYIKILIWLRGFRVKIANFLRLHCLAIPRRDLVRTKKTKPNIGKWPESLGVMLEFWYIERGLLVNALPHTKLLAYHTPLQWHVDFSVLCLLVFLNLLQKFSGNSDRNTVVSHGISPPIKASFIRILPLDTKTLRRTALRLELYGCDFVEDQTVN